MPKNFSFDPYMTQPETNALKARSKKGPSPHFPHQIDGNLFAAPIYRDHFPIYGGTLMSLFNYHRICNIKKRRPLPLITVIGRSSDLPPGTSGPGKQCGRTATHYLIYFGGSIYDL